MRLLLTIYEILGMASSMEYYIKLIRLIGKGYKLSPLPLYFKHLKAQQYLLKHFLLFHNIIVIYILNIVLRSIILGCNDCRSLRASIAYTGLVDLYPPTIFYPPSLGFFCITISLCHSPLTPFAFTFILKHYNPVVDVPTIAFDVTDKSVC